MPYLKDIFFNWDRLSEGKKNIYPFNLSALKGLDSISLKQNVTFFVGENGSGKSTLLEAVAATCGFNTIGGKDSLIDNNVDELSLSAVIRLSWFPKINNGFFFRSETFFDFAGYLDELEREDSTGYSAYGGKSLHRQSHGESFLSLFVNRFGRKGIYLLDEPEAALSPQNQLAFLRVIWDLEKNKEAQFLIATHSPMIMAYPDAEIFNFNSEPLEKINFTDTEHYQITKDFITDPSRYMKYLFAD